MTATARQRVFTHPYRASKMYGGDPHVVSLRGLPRLKNSSSEAWVVEFFAGWCGHCQAFKGNYKTAAAAMCSAAPQLRIAAVDCVENNKLCLQVGIKGYPTLRIFGAKAGPLGTPLQKCAHGCRSAGQVVDDVLKMAKLVAPAMVLTADAEAMLANSRAHECSKRAGTLMPMPRGTFDLKMGQAPPELSLRPRPLEDSTSAIMFGFEREVLQVPLLPRHSDRHIAFNSWLRLLSTSLPGARNVAAMKKLRLASTHVEDFKEWQSVLHTLPSPLLPDGGVATNNGYQWKACRGWSDASRGYPCGLWTLFHTLIAHSADDPGAALNAIRLYVQFFFGCRGCAAHFLQMAKEGLPKDAALLLNSDGDGAGGAAAKEPMPDGVHAPPATSAAAASLWLWRAHNAVNLRLNQTAKEEQILTLGLRKMIYPDTITCPTCRTPSGKWIKEEVVSYLGETYCHTELSECALPIIPRKAPPGRVLPFTKATSGSGPVAVVAAATASLDPLVTLAASSFLLLCVCACAITRGGGPRPHQKRGAARRLRALNSVGGALSSRKSYQGVPSSERIDSSEEEE